MTTASEAKARIVTLLAGATALAGVDVKRSGPVRESDVHPDMVFLGAVRGEQDWAAIGNRRRSEIYTIDLFILVWRAATITELATEQRCWDVFAAVEAALQTDPGLSTLLIGQVQMKSFEQHTIATVEPVGWRAGVDCRLAVTTKLALT